MSRSRRKTPKIAMTTALSEKADKVEAHRRTRHAVKVAVQATAQQGEDAVVAESEHPRSGQWRFAKDGKRWVGKGGPQHRGRGWLRRKRLRRGTSAAGGDGIMGFANIIRVMIFALTIVVLAGLQSIADGMPPAPLEPGQVLGNNGTAPAPPAPVRAWQGVASEHGFALYASPKGNDADNSCSDSGSPCTLKGACAVRSSYNTFLVGDSVAISLADGTYSAADDNNALCSVIGNIGGSSTILTSIRGNCSSPTSVVLAVPANAMGIFIKDGGEAGINCLEFTGGDQAVGIANSGQSAVGDYNTIYWGPWGAGGSHVAISSGGWVNLVAGGETLLADFTVHWNLSGNAVLHAGAPTRIPAALSWSHGVFLAASGPAVVDLGSWSVAGAGVAGSTGAKGVFNGPGYLVTLGNTPCGQILPGDGRCTFSNGFQDGAGEGLAMGLRQNPQSGSYAAAASDCGGRVVFDVTEQATLSLGVASRYPRDCDITVSNVGHYRGPGTARGVILAIDRLEMPNQGNVLYPGQTTVFSRIGGVWSETGYGQRQLWKPDHWVTFFVDCSAGSDHTSDGLGPGSGANLTLGHSFIRLSNFVDYSGGASQARWSTTGNCASGDVLHMAGPLRGGQGHAVFRWIGNGTTIVNPTSDGPCVSLFDHAVAEVVGLSCQSSGSGGCFSVSTGSVLLFITTASICNPGTGPGFVAFDTGSSIEFVNVGFSFGSAAGLAAARNIFSVQNGGQVIFDKPGTISFLGDTVFSAATIVSGSFGNIKLNGTTFDTGSFAVTGLRFLCGQFSVLGAGASPNTTIPGSVNGTVGPDCQAF
jgi:hypothetical protein